ncbi:uncharacterized protein LAJ45_08438 [Morchella importuna]|uniref:uncharacterized protein n=1 Tax=Morchella importuna TaxID=1174673 RepID=UPI001E8EE8BB|nr:uncharacterized protein LAJ45_08438 [Morchella importuna]KAH8147610.1 hypothetical protein LAJ45_08438 [Morchella importuna]
MLGNKCLADGLKEWDQSEESVLSDNNIEEGLVNLNELSQCSHNKLSIRISKGCHLTAGLTTATTTEHGAGLSDSSDDCSEALGDLVALEGRIDEVDLLGVNAEVVREGGDLLEGLNDLLGRSSLGSDEPEGSESTDDDEVDRGPATYTEFSAVLLTIIDGDIGLAGYHQYSS